MHDKEATVIIQSDHNWELSNLDKNIYGDRRRIFSMIKVPNKCKTYHTQNINNFNAARLALYCATGNNPKLIDTIKLNNVVIYYPSFESGGAEELLKI